MKSYTSLRNKHPGTNIYIDTRESKGRYLNFLANISESAFIMRPLKAGDILINDLIIERKRLSDLFHTLNEDRLFKQLKRLKSFKPRQLLLLEGGSSIPISQQAGVQGLYIRITAGWQIPIVHTKSPLETAKLVCTIARQEAFASSGPIKPRPRSKHFRDLSTAEKMLMQIPTIGYKRVDALLAHFKSLSGILAASEKELLEVSSIGPKRAKLIASIL